MSTGGVMGAAASGLAAQASRLATISDNVANASTTGYKVSNTEFYSLVEQVSNPGAYQAAGVTSKTRYDIIKQGTVAGTTSPTDLAIQGNGFFLVSDADGKTFLTRSGSFVPDATGRLVNGAGYYLMGCAPTSASAVGPTQVKIDFGKLTAAPSTKLGLQVNLPSGSATVAAANLPSTNTATATYSAKTSVVAYDNLGKAVNLDVYMSNTGGANWEVAVYDKSTASASGGFPYTSGPLATSTLAMSSTGSVTSGGSFSVPVPNGSSMTFDMSSSSDFAAPFSVQSSSVDGHGAASVDHIEVGKDGSLFSVFTDGSKIVDYKIPLATVTSPDQLAPTLGTAFETTIDSGPMLLGFPQAGGAGSIVGSALEQSNVDLASELTNMIETQRAYQANSKTFQAGAEMLDVLVNLK